MFDPKVIKDAITTVINDIVALANRVLEQFGYQIVGKEIKPIEK